MFAESCLAFARSVSADVAARYAEANSTCLAVFAADGGWSAHEYADFHHATARLTQLWRNNPAPSALAYREFEPASAPGLEYVMSVNGRGRLGIKALHAVYTHGAFSDEPAGRGARKLWSRGPDEFEQSWAWRHVEYRHRLGEPSE